MKSTLYILTIILLLTACSQNSQTKDAAKRTDRTDLKKIDTTHEETVKRVSFKNITEVIADSSYSIWVDKQDSSFSLALHFQYKDTLAISYSPECWLIFPYKVDENKLVVYWDNNIDTKYDFDIVKAINKTNKKYIGKPFMILELKNDTTFKVTYPLIELIKQINSSNKKRIFFPDKFNVVQTDEMYEL
jgi:hypothetical protein